jgi:hypothetical protein
VREEGLLERLNALLHRDHPGAQAPRDHSPDPLLSPQRGHEPAALLLRLNLDPVDFRRRRDLDGHEHDDPVAAVQELDAGVTLALAVALAELERLRAMLAQDVADLVLRP